MTARLLPLLPLLLAMTARAQAPRLGDLDNGALLIRVHCAACHGLDMRGGGELASHLPVRVFDLRDPAYLSTRSDLALAAEITKGGAKDKAGIKLMPAFPMLTNLDLWDIVAYLRNGQLNVADFFPSARFFTSKKYVFDANAVSRLEKQFGHTLPARDKEITLVAVFGQATGTSGPEALPADPINLDRLLPKEKVGYMVFAELPIGNKLVTTGIAIAKDGKVLKVASVVPGSDHLVDGYQNFIGQGAKGQTDLLKPASAAKTKGKPLATVTTDRAFQEAYARALEAITMWDREERERHWADPR
jgi:mono/diheme cytochrome c family protein